MSRNEYAMYKYSGLYWARSCGGLSVLTAALPCYSRIKVKRRTPCGSFASASSASTSVWGRVETDWPGQPRSWSSSQARPLCSPKVSKCQEAWWLRMPGCFLTLLLSGLLSAPFESDSCLPELLKKYLPFKIGCGVGKPGVIWAEIEASPNKAFPSKACCRVEKLRVH